MIIAMWLLCLAVLLLIINTVFMDQRILDLKHELWDSYDWIDPVACVVDDLEVPEIDEAETLRCLEDLKERNRTPYAGRH